MAAVGVSADVPLEGYSTVIINVNDVNVRPVFAIAPVFTIKEEFAVDGAYMGTLVATDPNR